MKSLSDETRRKMSVAAKNRCTPQWRKRMSELRATSLPIDEVRNLYDGGMTQTEIADKFGVTQKVLWAFMRRNGIAARVAKKRDQRGIRNSLWKGSEASYAALHLRVQSVRGKPSFCTSCGKTTGRFEWSNLTGDYGNVNDYVRLCVSCHRRMDAKRRASTGKRTMPQKGDARET